MNMKTTKIIQWVVFVLAFLAVFALAVALMLGAYSALAPAMGVIGAAALVVITSWGVGALLAYSFIQLGMRLADRGWFV